MSTADIRKNTALAAAPSADPLHSPDAPTLGAGVISTLSAVPVTALTTYVAHSLGPPATASRCGPTVNNACELIAR